MTTLVEFVTARLDEAARSVEANGPGLVAWLTYLDDDGGMLYTTVAASADERGESGIWIVDGEEAAEPSSVHVIYDPARVLRQVEAGRRMLARAVVGNTCGQAHPQADINCLTGHPDMEALFDLALPYLDHSDYDEGWRP